MVQNALICINYARFRFQVPVPVSLVAGIFDVYTLLNENIRYDIDEKYA